MTNITTKPTLNTTLQSGVSDAVWTAMGMTPVRTTDAFMGLPDKVQAAFLDQWKEEADRATIGAFLNIENAFWLEEYHAAAAEMQTAEKAVDGALLRMALAIKAAWPLELLGRTHGRPTLRSLMEDAGLVRDETGYRWSSVKVALRIARADDPAAEQKRLREDARMRKAESRKKAAEARIARAFEATQVTPAEPPNAEPSSVNPEPVETTVETIQRLASGLCQEERDSLDFTRVVQVTPKNAADLFEAFRSLPIKERDIFISLMKSELVPVTVEVEATADTEAANAAATKEAARKRRNARRKPANAAKAATA